MRCCRRHFGCLQADTAREARVWLGLIHGVNEEVLVQAFKYVHVESKRTRRGCGLPKKVYRFLEQCF